MARPMTATETLIEEIRESRRRMSAECGHNIAKYIAYLRRFNHQYAEEVRALSERRQTRTACQDTDPVP